MFQKAALRILLAIFSVVGVIKTALRRVFGRPRPSGAEWAGKTVVFDVFDRSRIGSVRRLVASIGRSGWLSVKWTIDVTVGSTTASSSHEIFEHCIRIGDGDRRMLTLDREPGVAIEALRKKRGTMIRMLLATLRLSNEKTQDVTQFINDYLVSFQSDSMLTLTDIVCVMVAKGIVSRDAPEPESLAVVDGDLEERSFGPTDPIRLGRQ